MVVVAVVVVVAEDEARVGEVGNPAAIAGVASPPGNAVPRVSREAVDGLDDGPGPAPVLEAPATGKRSTCGPCHQHNQVTHATST